MSDERFDEGGTAQVPLCMSVSRRGWLISVVVACMVNVISADQFGNFTYTDNGTYITITGYPSSQVGVVNIPASISGKPVTTIGNSAFKSCIGLTSVIIPSGVISIGSEAFDFCVRLTSMTIPSSVTSLGNGAFSGCSRLTSISISAGVTSIGDLAFSGCYGLTSVTIPSSVTRIGNLAFYACGGLTSVTILSGVGSIGDSAFLNCSGLMSVTIPSSVNSIGRDAFFGCSSLPSVTIPEGVTSIGDSAFENCSGLVSVIISNGITGIGNYMFEGCIRLTSVTIPSSVASIGRGAFKDCSGLTYISVDEANPSYSSLNGALFNKEQTSLVLCPPGKQGAYTIPASVTNIGESAFYGCIGLTSVTIPSNMTSIGIMTLYGSLEFGSCIGLSSILVDAANPSYSSLDGALFNKQQTSLVLCPPGKKGAYTLPSSVTSIGTGGFYGCSGLTSVTIPASVTSIGTGAFSACSGLAVAVFLGDAPVGAQFNNVGSGFKIYYFRGKTGFTSPTWIGYPTVMIDAVPHPAVPWLLSHGYPYDINLAEDPNGDGVPLLMAYALDLNPDLNLAGSMPEALLAPGLMSMTFYAASPGIIYRVETSIDLQTWVTEGVSLSALAPDNTRTARVTRSSPLQFLRLAVEDYRLFIYRTVGETIEITDYPITTETGHADIPAEINGTPVTRIGNDAFRDCSGLTSVTIPPTVTSIGDSAFQNCSGLVSVIIPERLASIGSGVFRDCRSLTSVTIPSSVTSIGSDAFRDCSGLTSVTIPASVTSIGHDAFYGCSGLTAAIFLGNAPSVTAVFGGVGSGFRIYYFRGKTGFTSPTWIGYPATEVDNRRYPAASWLLSHGYPYDINLAEDPNGDGVALLMAYALDLNPDLNLAGSMPEALLAPGLMSMTFYAASPGIIYRVETSIDLQTWVTEGVSLSALAPDNTRTARVTRSSPCQFLRLVLEEASLFTYRTVGEAIEITDYPTTETGKVDIPVRINGKPVTSIGQDAFRNCNGLTSVTIPSTVTRIGDSAFENCSGLVSVIIPEGVTGIGNGVFRDCACLRSVTIPSSVTSIGSGAFQFCLELTGVTIPSGVTSIGSEAFQYCFGLVSVTIPAGVTSIGDLAFQYCTALNTAVFLGDAPSLGLSVFSDVSSGFTIRYLSNRTGFTSPTWKGYPAIII